MTISKTKQTKLRFARVPIEGRKTRLIRVTSEKPNLVIGVRANKDGSDWSRIVKTKDGPTEESQVIVSSRILEELRLNLFFGELEPANEKEQL